jgi:hypothetical protein
MEVIKMKYKRALEIGRARAEAAAEAMQRWTSAKACAVCAVKPGTGWDAYRTGDWMPVGQQCYKEIARDDGSQGKGNYHLLVMDEEGVIKACSLERFPLAEALRLTKRLPMSVALPGKGELWQQLDVEANRMCVVNRAQDPDV